MVSIDERIKAELEKDDAEMRATTEDAKGLNDMVWDAYRSGPRKWLTLAGIAMFALTGVLIYLLVQFVGAETATGKLDWGVWSILTFMVIIGLELWSWMQVNRVATMREIRTMALMLKQDRDTD